MSNWTAALLIAVLVVTIPFTLVLKVLLRLPRVLASSHRRWPLTLNFVLIAASTAYMTTFVRATYYGSRLSAVSIGLEFLIAGVVYVFALVMLLRQFSGVYPEFIITTGRSGLALRKTRYRNIVEVEEVSESAGETRFAIQTAHAGRLSLTLPRRYVSIFYDQMRKMNQQG